VSQDTPFFPPATTGRTGPQCLTTSRLPPSRAFTSLDFLKNPKLPRDPKLWQSDLGGKDDVTQAQVDEILASFEADEMSCVRDYMKKYLAADTVILLRCLVVLHDYLFDILKLSFVESRKFTASSLANLGAMTYLARERRGAIMSVNHARYYSVSPLLRRGGQATDDGLVVLTDLLSSSPQMLKGSCIGAFTGSLRSVSGELADLGPYVDLAKEQLARGGPGGTPDAEFQARLDRSGQSLHDYLAGCNSHLLPGGGEPAKKVMYWDMNSM